MPARGLLLVVLGLLCFVPSANAGFGGYDCVAPCTITVTISNKFPESEKRIIREVMADFSTSPNIDMVESGGGDIHIVTCTVERPSNPCGFWTTQRWTQSGHLGGTYLTSAKIEIGEGWFGYCCDVHDGMRGVYCHELMHGIGESDLAVRTQPSCFNGTSPYLGVEDFAWIASIYPLP